MSTPADGRPGTGDAERVVEPDAVVVVAAVQVPAAAEFSIADEISARVLTVPDVVRLHAGRFGEVATYLPGRRVTGVRLADDLIEVHVVVAGQIPVRQTAQSIHEAVATVVTTPVHVFIEDVAA